MYLPPEAHVPVTNAFIGTSYDVWGLGCIFLEFVTWLLGGWDTVDGFLTRRLTRERPDDLFFAFTTGSFFTVEAVDNIRALTVSDSILQLADDDSTTILGLEKKRRDERLL
jgi:hypothetical protein